MAWLARRLRPGSRLERWARASQLHHLVFGARAVEPEPIHLGHRRVYVLPTLHGVTFGLALMLMLIGSVNYALSLGYALTFLLTGMSLVAMLHTFRNLAHLHVSSGRSEPVFAGTSAAFVLLADNRDRRDRLAIVARRFDARADVDIPAGETVAITLLLPAKQRGWLALGRVTLETRYPLGLFRAWSYVQPAVRVLVYPAPDIVDLPLDLAVPERGVTVEAGFGNDDFAGLRPYHPGDSPRHVAWRRAAHDDRLLTKQWSGRGAAELWLDWNLLAGNMDVEARLSRLTGWVLQAEAAAVQYGLRLPGIVVEPGVGQPHRDRCLRELALFGMPADAEATSDPADANESVSTDAPAPRPVAEARA